MSTETHRVATLAIGKTISAVATNQGLLADVCYDIRLDFSDGSSLLIKGGFIDGDIRATFTAAPSTDAPPSAAPPVRASDDG